MYIYDMKFRFILMVFAFLVICVTPVSFAIADVSDSESSITIDYDVSVSMESAIVVSSNESFIVNSGQAGKGFVKSQAEEARPPTVELYNNCKYKEVKNWQVGHSTYNKFRSPRDGINKRV